MGGCGGNGCNILQTALGDAGCRNLALSGGRTFTGTKASCAGTASSRRLTVSCPPTAGTGSQCNSALTGFPVFSLLVPNNANGSFRDDDGTLYSTCQDLLTAYNAGSLQTVTGVYASDSSTSGDTLSCTNAGGCTMTSAQCYAGWDKANSVTYGTASIPLGAKVLACTYIDTSSLGGPAPIAVRLWSALPYTITISGDLGFSTEWTDAY